MVFSGVFIHRSSRFHLIYLVGCIICLRSTWWVSMFEIHQLRYGYIYHTFSWFWHHVLTRSHMKVEDVLSTSEVEYMEASLCGQEIVYIRVILNDFGITISSYSRIRFWYLDTGIISLAQSSMFIKIVRCKYSCHIDTRRHYIPDLCLSGVVCM